LNKKTTRYVGSAQVLEHIISGKGIEIGFAAITEIRQLEAKGLKFVGPLPEQVQSSIPYSAAVVTDAPTEDIAREFVTYLATPAAKSDSCRRRNRIGPWPRYWTRSTCTMRATGSSCPARKKRLSGM